MSEPIDRHHMESLLKERLLEEGRRPEEIDSALRELRLGSARDERRAGRRRWEYKSQMSLFGLPLVHIVIGRDPATGGLGKAFGVIAIGRMAFGVLPIGQIAIGVLPIGQLAVGLLVALGQGAFAGYAAVGQVAIASSFATGQIAVAASAIGQFALGRYVLAQVGWGQHVWSTKIKDPVALEHFKNLYDWAVGFLFG